MPPSPSDSLLAAMRRLTDPRKPRGVRHPFAALLALTLLGLLCRQPDFLSIARWADDHWGRLRDALGFTRRRAPHNTTLSRACARFSLEEFREAVLAWLPELAGQPRVKAAAVDGKTSKQSRDADGDPIHLLNVFAHDLKVCLAQWKVGDGKDTEPEVLKAHLDELFAAYPGLQLLTGDALFCQRPLAELIVARRRHYLLAVKDNQPDLLEAARAAFAGAPAQTAGASTCEKKRGRSSRGGSGSMPRRGRTPARR
jgi:DDE_Tnp_1-associated